MAWKLDGTYFETCSCELVCPCNNAFGIEYEGKSAISSSHFSWAS